MLMQAAARAMRSLFIPGMIGLFFFSVLLTILVLFGFVAISSEYFIWLADRWPGNAWLSWVGGIGSFLLAWFLFPGIMPVIINFFDDRIARIIETHDYPEHLPAREPAFWAELWHDVRFSLIAIGLNLIVLPFYIFPVFGQLFFYGLNGYLLGREFFIMAARRHMPINEAVTLRRRYARPVWLGGVALAVLATVPVVNLFAPFWGIALMIHLYQLLPARTGVAEIIPPR